MCADPTLAVQLPSSCGNLNLATTLDHLAILTLVVSIGLIAILVGARLAAPRLDRSLGTVFRPLTAALLIGLVILLVVGSIVIVGGAYTTELSSTGAFHPYFVVIGAATGVALTIASANALSQLWSHKPFSIQAVPVDQLLEPKLFATIDAVAQRIGTELPSTVLAGLAPTFFVTELPVQAFDLPVVGRTMYLSMPLCRILDTDELEAVIGHELAHYHGGDTQLSRHFYPVYAGTRNAFEAFLASRGGLAGIVRLLPANVLALFFASFAGVERRMSRDRELAADDLAASSTRAGALSSALVKLDRYSGLWLVILAEAARKIRWRWAPGNLSAEFAQLAQASRAEGVEAHGWTSRRIRRTRIRRSRPDLADWASRRRPMSGLEYSRSRIPRSDCSCSPSRLSCAWSSDFRASWRPSFE